jgi:uncharacterized protein YgiM (DUF1202 family)
VILKVGEDSSRSGQIFDHYAPKRRSACLEVRQMYARYSAAARSIGLLFLCAVLTGPPASAIAADAPPYQARVLASGASIHSGPGEKFYATDTLSQGELVEVYREKSGWLGVRPPLNSFSWVAGSDLILKDGGMGEVVKDDATSRIGSRLNDKRNAAQVRLKKGEGVEVLGEEMVGGEKWYKIAPPAGEFRWIQKSLVERVGPIPTTSNESETPATSKATTPPVTGTPTAQPTNESGAPPLIPTSQPGDDNASAPAPATPASPTTPPSATPALEEPQASQPTGDLNQDVAAVELRLSRMAAAPANLWNTERLERDVAQLMARAKTPAERDAVRVTQEKINRFAGLTRRSIQANQTLGNVAQAGQSPTAPLPNTVATNAAGGPYDAVGILRPVVSRRPGAPQFALVDERGQVISFVSPAPDLNLRPYLGHRVGVVGNRGYIPEFQRANVTASRVTPLNDRLVR